MGVWPKQTFDQNAQQNKRKKKGQTNCRVQTGLKMSASDAILISH